MNPRNRSLVFSFFITLLIAGTVIYLFGVKKQPTPANNQLFIPGEVIKFGWKFKEANFEFTKNVTNSAWSPTIADERLTKKIDILAHLATRPINPADFEFNDTLTVTLQFTDGAIWSGALASDQFIWTSGPLVNHGTELNPAALELFHEGRFAFEPHRWDWCSDNLRKLTFEHDEEAVEVSRTGDDWEITSLGGDSKIVESTWIDSWIEKSCRTNVTSWIDLELEPFGLDEGNFEIEKNDGTRLEYAVRTPVFQISEIKAARSPELFQNLEELIQAP